MIAIGTAGYSYADWKGVFYPKGLDDKEMLSYYAREFGFTEVNSTYYRMPNRHMLWHMQAKTPPRFEFVIKAYKGLTHDRADYREHFAKLKEALQPLVDVGKLACVLAQFPTSFRNNEENRGYLRRFRDLLPCLPVVIEFRHREWINDETFQLLADENLGYVCVDMPEFKTLVPPVVRATADIGYVRFHGRNYKQWWQHEERHERYDYFYSEDELAEWVPKIKSLEDQTKKVYVSMNNHYRGQAVINGRMLQELLDLVRRPAKPQGVARGRAPESAVEMIAKADGHGEKREPGGDSPRDSGMYQL